MKCIRCNIKLDKDSVGTSSIGRTYEIWFLPHDDWGKYKDVLIGQYQRGKKGVPYCIKCDDIITYKYKLLDLWDGNDRYLYGLNVVDFVKKLDGND